MGEKHHGQSLIRLKVLTKTDENYLSIDMGYAKALDI